MCMISIRLHCMIFDDWRAWWIYWRKWAQHNRVHHTCTRTSRKICKKKIVVVWASRIGFSVLTQITYFLLKFCHVSCSQLSRSTCIPCRERWNWEPSTISGFDGLMVGTIDTINDYCIKTTKFMDKFALTNMLVACFWAISLTHKNACFSTIEFGRWVTTNIPTLIPHLRAKEVSKLMFSISSIKAQYHS